MEPVLLDHNFKKLEKRKQDKEQTLRYSAWKGKREKGGKNVCLVLCLGKFRAEIAQPVERVLIGSLQRSASSPGSFSVSRATAALANRGWSSGSRGPAWQNGGAAGGAAGRHWGLRAFTWSSRGRDDVGPRVARLAWAPGRAPRRPVLTGGGSGGGRFRCRGQRLGLLLLSQQRHVRLPGDGGSSGFRVLGPELVQGARRWSACCGARLPVGSVLCGGCLWCSWTLSCSTAFLLVTWTPEHFFKKFYFLLFFIVCTYVSLCVCARGCSAHRDRKKALNSWN